MSEDARPACPLKPGLKCSGALRLALEGGCRASIEGCYILNPNLTPFQTPFLTEESIDLARFEEGAIPNPIPNLFFSEVKTRLSYGGDPHAGGDY
jgi:hypothetical protein